MIPTQRLPDPQLRNAMSGLCNDNPVLSNDAGTGVGSAPHGKTVTLFSFFSPLLSHVCLFSTESDLQDAFCLSECRKEKEETAYYCHSEFGMYKDRYC